MPELIRLNLGKCGGATFYLPKTTKMTWNLRVKRMWNSLISQREQLQWRSPENTEVRNQKSLGFNSRSASWLWDALQVTNPQASVSTVRDYCEDEQRPLHVSCSRQCMLFALVALTAFSTSTEHNPVGSLSAHHHEIQQHNRILLTSCPPSSCYYSYLCDTVGGLKLRSIRKTTAWMNPFPGKEQCRENYTFLKT